MLNLHRDKNSEGETSIHVMSIHFRGVSLDLIGGGARRHGEDTVP